MSILIKGMEMPINCDSCRIMVLEDTNCDPELFCGCPLVFKAHPQGEDHRPDYCPLIELPPHGRLIDADALHYSRIRIVHPNGDIGGLNAVVMSAEIKDAPTIIEADHEEEEMK